MCDVLFREDSGEIKQSMEVTPLQHSTRPPIPRRSSSSSKDNWNEKLDNAKQEVRAAEAKVERANEERKHANEERKHANEERKQADENVEKANEELRNANEAVNGAIELVESLKMELENDEVDDGERSARNRCIHRAEVKLSQLRSTQTAAMSSHQTVVKSHQAVVKSHDVVVSSYNSIVKSHDVAVESQTDAHEALQSYREAYLKRHASFAGDAARSAQSEKEPGVFQHALRITRGTYNEEDLTFNDVDLGGRAVPPNIEDVENIEDAENVAGIGKELFKAISQVRAKLKEKMAKYDARSSIDDVTKGFSKLRVNTETRRRADGAADSAKAKDDPYHLSDIAASFLEEMGVDESLVEAARSHLKGFLEMTRLFDKEKVIRPRSEYAWAQLYYSPLITMLCHLLSPGLKNGMLTADEIWDCVCPILHNDEAKARVMFEVKPDCSIQFPVLRKVTRIAMIIVILFEFKNAECVGLREKEAHKGLFTALASMRTLELALGTTDSEGGAVIPYKEEMMIPYGVAAGPNIEIFLLLKNKATKNSALPSKYNVFSTYTKSILTEGKIDLRNVTEIFIVMWLLIQNTLGQSYLNNVEIRDERIAKDFMEIKQSKGGYERKRSKSRASESGSVSTRGNRSQVGSMIPRGRSLRQNIALSCVMASKMREVFYPYGVTLLHPATIQDSHFEFVTKARISYDGRYGQGRSEYSRSWIYEPAVPEKSSRGEFEQVMPHVIIKARKGSASQRLSELDVLRHLKRLNEADQLPLLFARLHDWEDFPEEQTLVLIYERVGLQVTRVVSAEGLRCDVLQLLKTLRALHADAHVVHGDIKPSNICKDDEGKLRLIDFEFAGVIAEGEGSVRCRGHTPDFAAPEAVHESRIGCKADVYSAGKTIEAWSRLLAGNLPFENESIWVIQESQKLARWMTKKAAHERASAQEALLYWKKVTLATKSLPRKALPISPVRNNEDNVVA